MTKRFDTDWENETYTKSATAMKELLNLANSMGSSKAVVTGMLDALVTEHRTLQQSCIRNFAAMLQEWAGGSEDALTDLRNQAAWEFAQQVRKIDPVMPLI